MKKAYWKKFMASLLFSSVGFFTLFFFSPLEVYLGNPASFKIYTDSAVLVLFLASAVISLAFSFAVSFLPTKPLKHLNLTIFGVTLCFYLQAMLLNGELIILNGEQLQLTAGVKFLNILIWLVIFLGVFALWFLFKKKRKEKVFITATKFIAAAVALMQLTGFVSLYLSCDKSVNDTKSLYFSNKGELQLSNQKNVVVFIVDYCDSYIVEEALAQDPEMFSGLSGFTYYPDTLYSYCRTYPAVPYLLTGNRCYYDTPYAQYAQESFDNSAFLKDMDVLGTDIRLYTEPSYTGGAGSAYIDNYGTIDSTQLSNINPFGFLWETFKVSGFRGAPYVLKPLFAYVTEDVNTNSLHHTEDFTTVVNDLVFYDTVQNTGVSVNGDYSSAFRFYHMYGSHPGAVLNENAEYEANVSLPQALRGDIKIIQAYLDQLKELGLYDNTTVIITADHGDFPGELIRPQTCLMLVKMADADSTAPLKTSNAPISHDDMFATVIKGLGGDYAAYGKSIDEIAEDEVRTRYHYNTVVRQEDFEEMFLYEYLVTGDGRDLANYQKTGKEWTIYYSIYKS